MTDEKRAGLVLRVDGALVFVPAALAATVTQVGKITRVAGAPEEMLGIAMHEGQVVPVVAIGRARTTTMLVCSHMGEAIGLVGAEVVEAGVTASEATPIDLAAIYARIQDGAGSSLRSARWGA
jgi:chemotaxis signal transduction protein